MDTVLDIVIYGTVGLVMAGGFHISGMVSIEKMKHFLSLVYLEWGSWDPSLLVTFATALGIHFVLYHVLRKSMKKPVFFR